MPFNWSSLSQRDIYKDFTHNITNSISGTWQEIWFLQSDINEWLTKGNSVHDCPNRRCKQQLHMWLLLLEPSWLIRTANQLISKKHDHMSIILRLGIQHLTDDCEHICWYCSENVFKEDDISWWTGKKLSYLTLVLCSSFSITISLLENWHTLFLYINLHIFNSFRFHMTRLFMNNKLIITTSSQRVYVTSH
jgi:hypothetical protein